MEKAKYTQRITCAGKTGKNLSTTIIMNPEKYF